MWCHEKTVNYYQKSWRSGLGRTRWGGGVKASKTPFKLVFCAISGSWHSWKYIQSLLAVEEHAQSSVGVYAPLSRKYRGNNPARLVP